VEFPPGGRMSKIIAATILSIVGLAAAGLLWSNLSIRTIEPELPSIETILAVGSDSADLPVSVRLLDTASQAMRRNGVLERSLDPNPVAEYVMAFPAFALEWADGRIFLIDLGMDRSSALGFGEPAERILSADPIEFHADVAELLGKSIDRVAGVGFSHLHVDHTDGGVRLCESAERAIPLFQTPLQADRSNYTTRPGRERIEQAGCLEAMRLDEGPLYSIPGFPGLSVFATGGHTPGSQVFVARVRNSVGSHLRVFTGDLVNNIDGVRYNVPKPALYSLFVVPEHRDRLDLLRRMLAELSQRPGVDLLVSHDLLHLESMGLGTDGERPRTE
jgi:glyoxylase-like metal-dependent hydrolase (beta-lactamase superfamily II)